MILFWKTAAAVLIASVLVPTVAKQEKDLALLLSMMVCVMAALAAFLVLEPVMDFFYQLAALGDLHGDILAVILKVTGIALVSELVQMICQDSGNVAMAKGIQILTTAVILSLSVPILESMIDFIGHIMGEL